MSARLLRRPHRLSYGISAVADGLDCRLRPDRGNLLPYAADVRLDDGSSAQLRDTEGAEQNIIRRHRLAHVTQQVLHDLRLRERQRRLLFAVPQRLPRHVVDDIAGDDALQFRGCMCALPHAPYSTKWK